MKSRVPDILNDSITLFPVKDVGLGYLTRDLIRLLIEMYFQSLNIFFPRFHKFLYRTVRDYVCGVKEGSGTYFIIFEKERKSQIIL
jgi:hypothetical protein